MEIVHGGQMAYEPLPFAQRSGSIAFKRLFRGTEGTPGHYLLFLARQGDFYSPIHRHNFEQFRYMYRGSLSLAQDLMLEEGELSYHPEGVYYGPQHDVGGDREVLILQCGGASGQGYLSFEQTTKLQEALKERGRIESGKFYPNNGGEPQDAFEAMWEANTGQRLEYPAPRYNEIIVTKPDNYAWVPVPDRQNAYRKQLGSFTECHTMAEMIKIDAGDSYMVPAAEVTQLLFVVSGAGEADGKGIERESTIRLSTGNGVTLISPESMVILHFALPDLSHILGST